MKFEQLAPAKINLGLHVLRRRSDGYHDVETALVRIPWCDRLVTKPADELALTCSDPHLPVDERNLCVQAADLLRSTYGVERGARLHLEKRIPSGAGLGGGSSDAASTLSLLNKMWELNLNQDPLMELGAQLGADVPFFLGNGAMMARGIGTELSPLHLNVPLWAVVCVPDVEIATAEAYSWIRPSDDDRPNLEDTLESKDLARWSTMLTNDFQDPVANRCAPVREALTALDRQGATYVALSGSGSAVYGLFAEESCASKAASAIIQSGRHVWHGPLQW